MSTCPTCNTRYASGGEPNCWCSSGSGAAPTATSPDARRLRLATLSTHEVACTVPATKPDAKMPPHETTEQQLADLVDIAANLALRLTTATPGVVHIRTKRPIDEGAPVNVGILHALDDRARYAGDVMPEYLRDEQWRCGHHSHGEDACPHENDDAGRQGVLPDLWTWARMVEADLHESDPQLPDELPDPVTMAGVCGWLIKHWPRWQERFPREAGECARDVQRWHQRLRTELGEHDPPALRHGGIGGCGNTLAQLADGVRYECRGCREVLSLHEMLSLAKWHSAVTLAEAAEMTKVPLSTLKHWAVTGRIEPATHHRPRLYWMRDITHEADRRTRA